jgi:hypothetical protein
MDWDRFREQLRREAREYLADIRDIIEALHRAEGWIALGLVIAAVVVVNTWFITGLGFSPIPSTTGGSGLWRTCSPITNRNALILGLDAVVMLLLAVFAVGEMMAVLSRMRQGRPAEPRLVAGLAAGMLVFGIAGIVFMRMIC